jgi:hypothetical protein
VNKDVSKRPFVDRESAVWEQMRCAGCGRAVGYTSPSSLSRALYCSSWCIWEHEVRHTPAQRVNRISLLESRNDGWYWLLQAGYRPAKIAALYGVKNDFRVHRAIQSRRRDDAGRLRAERPRIARVTLTRIG